MGSHTTVWSQKVHSSTGPEPHDLKWSVSVGGLGECPPRKTLNNVT